MIKSQTSGETSILEIKYNITFAEDTLNKNSTISEPMVLLTNERKSIFFSEYYKNNIDEVGRQLRNIENGNVTIDLSSMPRSKFKYNVYRDNDEIFVTNYLGRNPFTFKVENPISWKIFNNETKKVLGYICHKATAVLNNKSYIAWFTYDIPISDGPYRFKGLPGLLLKINESHNYLEFDVISIIKKVSPIEFKKGFVVTRQQYLDKREEYLQDPSQGKINTLEYRKGIEENKKKHNNFLE